MSANKRDTAYLFFTDFYQNGNKPWAYKPNTLPYAVLGLNGYLKVHGFKSRIIDTRVEDYKKIDYSDALIFGLSTRTGAQIYNNLEIVRFLKDLHPQVPMVWGGVHSTLEAEQTARSEYVDIVVKHEGELTLLELVQLISAHPDDWKNRINNIKGLVFKSGNSSVIVTPDRDFMDLNDLPLYDFSDVKADRYALSVFPLSTSRAVRINAVFAIIYILIRSIGEACLPKRYLSR